MPRNRSAGRSAPSRPTVSRQPSAPAQHQQTRPNATYAAPGQHQASPQQQQHQAPPAQSQGPGLFGQMASTAAGVAVGSSIGHAIGGFFGGGSSAPAEQQQNQTNAAPHQAQQLEQRENNCAGVTQQFTKCMDEHGGNMQICNWYLEQLKACQAAASPY